ncbi:hypothetical protein [Faecalibacterium taiwanense]|jgi:hypothetical protein
MLICHLEQQILCIAFTVNTVKSVSDLNYLCGHCDTCPKIFDKSSIAIAKRFDNSKEDCDSSKQGHAVRFTINATAASSAFVYTNAYFALQNACWEIPKPFVFCIRWMQAARF